MAVLRFDATRRTKLSAECSEYFPLTMLKKNVIHS